MMRKKPVGLFAPLFVAGALAALLTLGLSGCGSRKDQVKLQGAGASFPAPLYQKWFKDYSNAHDNVQIDYQSVGSGSGKKAVLDGTVDFGASDAAMTEEEMAKVKRGVVLLPMTAGSIVLTYNLEGVKDLKLSRKAYSGIFLGTVTKWSDPLIAKDNMGANLPDGPINVVVRNDSSGTTYVFTKHLAAINPAFAKKVGVDTMPNWPVGTRSKGNEGVTASIQTTPGAIGYVEYGYAKGTKLPAALLENHDGKFVEATPESGQAALASTKLPENLIAWNPDPAGKGAYPIVTFTWLIAYKEYDDAKKADALKDVIHYGVTKGQDQAEPLGYIPLPKAVVEKVEEAAKKIQGGKKAARLTAPAPGWSAGPVAALTPGIAPPPWADAAQAPARWRGRR
jgi:phosphate transport system substrate-binding protein